MMFGTRTKPNTTAKFQRTDFEAFQFWRAFLFLRKRIIFAPENVLHDLSHGVSL